LAEVVPADAILEAGQSVRYHAIHFIKMNNPKQEDGPMKKMLYVLFTIGIVLSVSSSVYADDKAFTIKLREWFPGFNTGGVTVGALASGNIFDIYGNNVGWVNICWNHSGEGIEECKETTTLLRIKIVMNFYDGARLVLVGPADGTVGAYWGYDDPNPRCQDQDGICPLIGYSNFLDPNTDPDDLKPCEDTGDTDAAYIARVPSFRVVRQRFGSYGKSFRWVTWASVSGFLDHTPIVSPAVVGEVVLN
jgi:hypothetical protein